MLSSVWERNPFYISELSTLRTLGLCIASKAVTPWRLIATKKYQGGKIMDVIRFTSISLLLVGCIGVHGAWAHTQAEQEMNTNEISREVQMLNDLKSSAKTGGQGEPTNRPIRWLVVGAGIITLARPRKD